ncbi:protein of unknown function DUF125 transmembrane [Beutenbergia cavernae DSM 12333]|uniref:VIT family protein n=1 Tax=Beutenbergia cavernae (strain ATCC BAA-8 / DSM 12333 / CCUG 43141 / JCM 11478 / NBRC 16432 / NCIMB 13614 / HKI 0122) TaxID=471853 RepID=C5BX19_BEUC1|nr:VIT1/CCC1 transporter family protein [Beutenbergia cavernae]ACQ78694.1 protein of unknown function DUF125 transmembrane [Beutenbergia cavernae DSM 12333]
MTTLHADHDLLSPTSASSSEARSESGEPLAQGLAARLNWLRAGVLGANDGIVSVAAVVVGVAGATSSTPAIVVAGAAALVGGALSMALGEYVSVSSARDSQHAVIARARRNATDPERGLADVAAAYERRGVSAATARQVAAELVAHDADAAHLEAAGIDEDDVVSPWHAAGASALAFVLGALLPFLTVLLVPAPVRIVATVGAVLVALAVLGAAGARLGRAPMGRPTARVVLGGALALAVTYGIGSLLGVTGVV